MEYDEIVGHSEIKKRLGILLAADRVPHALLFSGPEGIGKQAVARVFAAGLLCSSDDGRPCGQCFSCRNVAREAHPDLFTIMPDGMNIKIDQIRALQRAAALSPVAGRRRVCIIDNAHKMTDQAANSLLKLLEEPPESFVFILISASPHELLRTIVSRCSLMRFHPLSRTDLTEYLVRQGFSADQAAVAARLSSGRVGEALALLGPDGLSVRDKAVHLLQAVTGGDMRQRWGMAAEYEQLGQAAVLQVLNYAQLLVRDLLVCRTGQADKLLYNLDIREILEEMARSWTEPGMLAALAELKAGERAVRGKANVRLICEALFIRLQQLAGGGNVYANSSRHPV